VEPPMLTRRYFLALLSSFFVFPGRKPAIGTEEDSALGDFDEANAPLEQPYISLIQEPRPRHYTAADNGSVYLTPEAAEAFAFQD
jgi:hypothetical protein